MTLNGVELRHIWNPYFETSFFAHQLEAFSKEKHGHASHEGRVQYLNQEYHSLYSVQHEEAPGLVLLGAGCWFAVWLHNHIGYPLFKSALDNITEILHLEDLPNFGTAPMDPQEGIGAELFIAPVKPPNYDLLPKWRMKAEGYQRGEVEALNEYLYNQEGKHNLRLLRSFPALSYEQPETMVDLRDTGMHVIDSVAETKANILLNLRCNAKLDRKISYPFNRTCCTDYGLRSWAHVAIIWIAIIYTAFWTFTQLLDRFLTLTTKWWRQADTNVATFTIALLYCYLADRTQVLAKESKEFSYQEFGTLGCICFIAVSVTIRKTKPDVLRHLLTPTSATLADEANVLSGDQIAEWKGLMQFATLIYYWTGASGIFPLEIVTRLLISIYLFHSSYCHTKYFLIKKDFSFHCIAITLLRLNILSCTLAYIMGTNHTFYYLPSLLSFWFLITYITFAIYRGLNDTTEELVGKISASFILVTVVLKFTPICKGLFTLLYLVFHVKWNCDAWITHANADGVIPFIGMFAGVISQRVKHGSAWYTDYRSAIIPSIVGIVGCIYFFSRLESESAYITLYPSLSVIPILCLIALRNATTTLRNYHSTAAAWLGRCSLEAYVFQSHIFLAGDATGVLLLDTFSGYNGRFIKRWRDLVVLLPIFLWISHLVTKSVKDITALLLDKPVQEDTEDNSQLNGIESSLKYPGKSKLNNIF